MYGTEKGRGLLTSFITSILAFFSAFRSAHETAAGRVDRAVSEPPLRWSGLAVRDTLCLQGFQHSRQKDSSEVSGRLVVCRYSTSSVQSSPRKLYDGCNILV